MPRPPAGNSFAASIEMNVAEIDYRNPNCTILHWQPAAQSGVFEARRRVPIGPPVEPHG